MWVKRGVPVLLLLLFALAGTALAAEGVITVSDTLLSAEDTDGYSTSDTALGCFAADAVRWSTGADFALINTGELGANLQAGTVTEASVALSFPQNSEIYVTEINAKELTALLEGMVAAVVLSDAERIDKEESESDMFPQISGFKLVYDVPSLPGEKVSAITAENGAELNLTDTVKRYTLAAPLHILQSNSGTGDLSSGAKPAGSLRSMVVERILDSGITEPELGRIKATGAHENSLISMIPTPLLGFCVLLMAIFSGYHYRSSYRDER